MELFVKGLSCSSSSDFRCFGVIFAVGGILLKMFSCGLSTQLAGSHFGIVIAHCGYISTVFSASYS